MKSTNFGENKFLSPPKCKESDVIEGLQVTGWSPSETVPYQVFRQVSAAGMPGKHHRDQVNQSWWGEAYALGTLCHFHSHHTLCSWDHCISTDWRRRWVGWFRRTWLLRVASIVDDLLSMRRYKDLHLLCPPMCPWICLCIFSLDLLVSNLPIVFLPGSFQPSHLLPRSHVYIQPGFFSFTHRKWWSITFLVCPLGVFTTEKISFSHSWVGLQCSSKFWLVLSYYSFYKPAWGPFIFFPLVGLRTLLPHEVIHVN